MITDSERREAAESLRNLSDGNRVIIQGGIVVSEED